jgi:hypothetical protein
MADLSFVPAITFVEIALRRLNSLTAHLYSFFVFVLRFSNFTTNPLLSVFPAVLLGNLEINPRP